MAALGWTCRGRPKTPHARIICFCGETWTVEPPTRSTRADHYTAGRSSMSTTTFLQLGPLTCTTAGVIQLVSAVTRAVQRSLQRARRRVGARSASSRSPRAPHFAASKVPRLGLAHWPRQAESVTGQPTAKFPPPHSEHAAPDITCYVIVNTQIVLKWRPHTSSRPSNRLHYSSGLLSALHSFNDGFPLAYSNLLGWDATSFGWWFPTFRSTILHSP